jgi:hypothetical protein
MKKVKLQIEELDVESFHTGERTVVEGTVHAHQQQQEEYAPSEASGCTCTTGGTAFFTEGCGAETWYTAHWKAC